jgi:hypothetical protein
VSYGLRRATTVWRGLVLFCRAFLRAATTWKFVVVLRRFTRDVTTWLVLVVFLLGASVGFLVLFADRWSWHTNQIVASHSSPVVLWAALLCAQTGLWALALLWLLPTIRSLPGEYRRANRNEIVGSSIVILAIVIAISVSGMVHPMWPNYFRGHAIKLGMLTILGGLVGLVAARGVWSVHGGLKLLARRDLGSDESLKTFLSLRDDAGRFLSVLGAIIGLLVLTTGAQRRAVLWYSSHHDIHTHYGFELVLLYGFLFTVLVAAVYLPTSLTITEVGNRIRDAVFPPVPASRPEWADRLEKREKLGQLLGLEQGPVVRLKAGVAILTPLIGSLVGLLLSAK